MDGGKGDLKLGPRRRQAQEVSMKLVVIYFRVVTRGKVETLFRVVTVVTVVTVADNFVNKSCLGTEVRIVPVRSFGTVVSDRIWTNL